MLGNKKWSKEGISTRWG